MPDTTSVSAQEMEAGYLEYRRACYKLLLQDAREQELLDLLGEARTLDDVVAKWGRGGEPATIGRLLTALAGYGALSTDSDTGAVRYRTRSDFEEKPIDRELMEVAVGADHADTLIHSKSYGNLVKVARDGNNIVGSNFTAANTKVWDEFLTLPFYEYFRKSAVRALVETSRPGGVVLDAACGLGYGIVELREGLDQDTVVVGADISHDFIGMAVDRTRDHDNVILARLDLESGLPVLAADTFDGAMIVGAWHFLTKPDDVLAQFARVLRPGGVLAIGYYYTSTETFDRPLMDLRLLLREPIARSTDPAELSAKAEQLGLDTGTSFTIGCFGFMTLSKKA